MRGIQALAEEIKASGGSAEALVLDVTEVAGTGDFISAHGPFDILVNNAGTNRPKPVWEVSEDDYDAVLGLNLKSAFFVARAVAMGMIERNARDR